MAEQRRGIMSHWQSLDMYFLSVVQT